MVRRYIIVSDASSVERGVSHSLLEVNWAYNAGYSTRVLDVAAGVEQGVGEPATNRHKLFGHDQVQRRVQLIAASA